MGLGWAWGRVQDHQSSRQVWGSAAVSSGSPTLTAWHPSCGCLNSLRGKCQHSVWATSNLTSRARPRSLLFHPRAQKMAWRGLGSLLPRGCQAPSGEEGPREGGDQWLHSVALKSGSWGCGGGAGFPPLRSGGLKASSIQSVPFQVLFPLCSVRRMRLWGFAPP